MAIKREIMVSVIIAAVFNLCGCATSYIHNHLDGLQGPPYLNLPVIVRGNYCGEDHLGNSAYARLHLMAENGSQTDLLLPMDAKTNAYALWRDYKKIPAESLNPVVVVNNPDVKRELNVLLPLLPQESWQGYPTKIIIFHDRTEERVYVAYRAGPKDDDVCLSITNATYYHSQHSKWWRSTLSIVLTPVAYIVDFVTFPLQAVELVYTLHKYKNKQVTRSTKLCINTVAISHDGSKALSGSSDHLVRLWDIKSGQLLSVFKGHSGEVYSVAFSKNDRFAISGAEDGTIKMFDIASNCEIRTFYGHTKGVKSVQFTPNGRHILSGSQDGTMRLWEIESGKEIRRFGPVQKWMMYGIDNPVHSIAVSPDERYVVAAYDDFQMRFWNIDSGEMIRVLNCHSNISSLALSPDGRYIISGGSDETVHVWENESGWEIRSYNESEIFANCSPHVLAFSPDGRYILSAGCDTKLREFISGEVIRSVTEYPTRAAAISPNGTMVLSGGEDGKMVLWDIESGKAIRKFQITSKP